MFCYPGTVLYEEGLKLGFQSPDPLEAWGRFIWTDYLNLEIPWVPPARRRRLTWLYYYTVLMNPNYMFIRSHLFTAVATLLRPLAQWRVRRFDFRLPLAAWLMHKLHGIVV